VAGGYVGMNRLRAIIVAALALLFSTDGLGQTNPTTTAAPVNVNVNSLATPAETTATDDGAADTAEDAPPATSEVRVHPEYRTIDLVVQNDWVTNVLQKLAIQLQRNIVSSAGAKIRANATIYQATLPEALAGLLHPNGLGYLEQGEFIYVYTAAELLAIESAGRQRSVKVISLDYIRPADAVEFALPLLSPEGKMFATKDLTEGAGAAGGGGGEIDTSTAENEVYTPNEDEFALQAAVVVHDYSANIAAVEAFLKSADVRPPEVLLECTIVRTRLTEANAFGVDFAMFSGGDFGDFFTAPIGGSSLGVKGNLSGGEAFGLSNAGNTGLGEGNLKVGAILGDKVGIFLRALDRVTDVTLLSNPKVLVLNRQRAYVIVGTRVGYLETTVVENQVLQSVEFIDTGIVLDIRPYILANGQIRLELIPKVSDVDFREVDGVGGTQQIPDENIQTVTTDVLVPEGHTAVIGGLFREVVTKTQTQVPVLGDIPLVGAAFRGHDDSTDWTEIIFLIKPTVVRDDMLIGQGERGDAYAERTRVGTRLGLLPWSRERQSSKLNLEAERYLADGERDRALWTIRRSLELHPLQPEIIRLHEQLVSDPQWWPTRSILERTVNAEAERSTAAPAGAGG